MPKKAFDNVEKGKRKVKVVLAKQWLASPFVESDKSCAVFRLVCKT